MVQFILTLMLFLIVASPLAADQVSLKNGDRMTGELQSIQGGKVTLQLQGPATGAVVIGWEHLSALATAKLYRVKMTKGDGMDGKILHAAGDIVVIEKKEDKTAVTLRIAEVASILPVPPENPPPPAAKKPPPAKWSGNLGFSTQVGSTARDQETQYVNLNSHVTQRSESDRLKLSLSYYNNTIEETKKIGKVDEKVKTRNHATTGEAEYDYFVWGNLYGYGHVEQERNDGKEIDKRNERGVGLGYMVLERPGSTLMIESGWSYLSTEYKHKSKKDGESLDFDRETTFRLSIEASQKITDFLSMSANAVFYIDSDLEEGTDHSRESGSFNFKLTEQWFLNLSATHKYDEKVPDGVENSEVLYSSGITYRF